MRKVSLPLHTEWLDELPGVEKPGTARQMLHKLCSLDDAPYQGEAPEAKYFDAALVHARLTDAGRGPALGGTVYLTPRRFRVLRAHLTP